MGLKVIWRMSDMEAPPLAIGATAELLAWKDGHVLKLFRERSPYHGHGLAATRAASATGLPVPMVVDGLIEVEDREGVVFEHRGAGRAASPGDAPQERRGSGSPHSWKGFGRPSPRAARRRDKGTGSPISW